MGINGFFQIMVEDDGTYLKIVPPSGDGSPVMLDDIKSYLERKNIKGYEIVDIGNTLKKPEGGECRLFSKKELPVSEDMVLTVSDNRMSAIARFYPPSNTGSIMNQEEIIRSIGYQGIKYGIQKDQIEDFLADRQYCTDYYIAAGTPEVQGTDAEITYHFNTAPNAKPKLNEDGSVDFHNLETFSVVKQGDVVATLVKEVYGITGKDVLGNELAPRPVLVKRLKYGKDIEISEDELSITSLIDGHVLLNSEEKVMVSNIYVIEGDVDTSTGDIKYDGNIVVRGNVRAGYTIIATGNIDIDGVVEGARVFSQGQIVLKRGIQGMGKGVLHAKGKIIAKFIESAMVSSEQSVETESIMHSKVDAKTEVIVRGKKGVIVGGHVRATMLINAQRAGSAMGGTTVLQVGADPGLQDKVKALGEEKKNLEADQHKLRQILDLFQAKKEKGQLDPEKSVLLDKNRETYDVVLNRLKEIEAELEQCHEGLAEIKQAKIKVNHEVNQGVKIMMGNEYLILSKPDYGCLYTLQKDGISRTYA